MAVRLTEQRWEEISGVDEPANTTPGFLLMKSKDGAEELKGNLELFEKSVVEGYEWLDGDVADAYFEDAPDDVRKARETLIAHLDDGLEDDDDGDEPKETFAKRVGDLFKKKKKPAEGSDEEEATETADEEAAEDAKKKKKVKKETATAEETDEEVDEDDEEVDPTDEVDEDDDDEADEDDDDEDDEDDEVDEADETVDEEEDAAPAAGADVEEITKSVVGAVEKQIEPLKEVLDATLDRLAAVEKRTAVRASLNGQETLGDLYEDEDDEQPSRGLAKAVRAAALKPGTKVRLGS